jgi:hypothetical protein
VVRNRLRKDQPLYNGNRKFKFFLEERIKHEIIKTQNPVPNSEICFIVVRTIHRLRQVSKLFLGTRNPAPFNLGSFVREDLNPLHTP